MYSFILSFVLSIQGCKELGGSWNCSCLGCALCVKGSDDPLVGPLGRSVGASVSCHTRCGLVCSCSGCKLIENVVVGTYIIGSVVKLIVDI